MRARLRHSQSGMTLLELLVAMVVLSLLVVMLARGVGQMSTTWTGIDARALEASDRDQMQARVRRLITAARPDYASADRADHRVAFTGSAQQLFFIGPRPDMDGDGPWARLRLHVAPRGKAQALFLDWQPDPPYGVGDAPARVLLLDNVTALELAYYGVVEEKGEAEWHMDWREQSRLPDLVRLRVRRAGTGLPAVPDIVVAPRVMLTNGCTPRFPDNLCRRLP